MALQALLAKAPDDDVKDIDFSQGSSRAKKGSSKATKKTPAKRGGRKG